jgi:arginyl-tRNA synthetase
MMGEMKDGEAVHIDYGFMSFKGEVLSTRKGNMVLANDVIDQAKEKVAKIIQEKNPDLPNKDEVVSAVAKGALKYYDLSHNRHSDIDFNWDDALDFEGNSGPYLQYTYARLSSILRKVGDEAGDFSAVEISSTEQQLILETTKLPEIVAECMQDYLPNLMANYLYELANLTNKFYHESPVANESDPAKKAFRTALIKKIRIVLADGLELLGIKTLEQM